MNCCPSQFTSLRLLCFIQNAAACCDSIRLCPPPPCPGTTKNAHPFISVYRFYIIRVEYLTRNRRGWIRGRLWSGLQLNWPKQPMRTRDFGLSVALLNLFGFLYGFGEWRPPGAIDCGFSCLRNLMEWCDRLGYCILNKSLNKLFYIKSTALICKRYQCTSKRQLPIQINLLLFIHLLHSST